LCLSSLKLLLVIWVILSLLPYPLQYCHRWLRLGALAGNGKCIRNSVRSSFWGQKLLGQPDDVAELSRMVSIWMASLHFTFTFQFPLKRFLLSQLKNMVIAWECTWSDWHSRDFEFFLVGLVFGLFGYVACGGCPLTGTDFSLETFSGLWEFAKLSAASGVILWLPMHLRELVLENIGIDDWKFAECRDCRGCFVYLHDNKWLGNDDSSPFFASTG
ncbi:hypothetical protein CUMW_039130, partial [Citrus unshiu]